MGTATDSLGWLVDTHPSAAAVLFKHDLDFCDGGDVSLQAACAAAGLDADAILAEIEREDERRQAPFISWNTRPAEHIVAHIVERYHRPLQGEFARLLKLAEHVDRTHGAKDARLAAIRVHVGAMRDTLLPHIHNEEELLFPRLVTEPRKAALAIQAMRGDHDDVAEQLRALEQLTDRFHAPAAADPPWRALLAGLETLDRELREHLHLEHNVLVPLVLA